jgi:predicted nucleic acid-binding protein
MSRIFWDTMLFVYLMEGHAQFAPLVREALEHSYQRGDILLTSHLALGEVMAGGAGDRIKSAVARSTIVDMGFSFLPFDGNCVATFSNLRTEMQLKAPDSIHLACAAAAGVDMFLTGDAQLLKRRLHVPGIHFITDFKIFTL